MEFIISVICRRFENVLRGWCGKLGPQCAKIKVMGPVKGRASVEMVRPLAVLLLSEGQ